MEWPTPDAPAQAGATVPESKPLVPQSQPEQKLDTNGSLSATEASMKPVEVLSSEPSATPINTAPVEPASSTAAPVINGSGSSSEHNGTNGLSHAAEPSPDKSESVSTQSVSAAPVAQLSEDKPAAQSSIATPSSAQNHNEKPRETTPVVKPSVEESAPETSKEAPKELPREDPKEDPKEDHKEEPKAEPKETPKEPEIQSKPVESKPEPKSEPEDTVMGESATLVDKPATESTTPAPAPAPAAPVENPSAEPLPTAAEPAKLEVPVSETAKEPEDVKMEDAPQERATTPKAPEQPATLQTQDSVALPTSEVDLQPASMSQLNIETQPDTSPIINSVEVSMGDAPTTKVAREREDDDGHEEPAPKRAKTEPEEDKPRVATAGQKDEDAPLPEPNVEMGDAGGAAEHVPSLETLPNWNDPEANGRGFSSHQRREIRKTIGRLKKTKGGANFRDAVVKLWPQLREAYLAKIDKPMDLSELDRNVRDGEGSYATFGEFKKAASLIYLNALNFNGSTHDVTFAAFNVIRTLWDQLLSAPAEEPSKPKHVAKKSAREPRVVPTVEAAVPRRQSTGPRGSPSTDADAKSAAGDRRGSTATEGDRPKRTVRAPKPKDIDYTTKPSRKKLKPELQFALEVLAEVMHPKYESHNMWFLEPVDAEGLNIPDYYSIIKKPMDLGKVSQMLSTGEFTSLKDFDKHVRLVWENCYSFNGPPSQGNPVSLHAAELEGVYTAQMKSKDAWLARFAKANAPTSADVSDDEDDEDDAEDAAASEDHSKEIQELSAKLSEETKKLHDMFVPGANQSMIDIQKGIVDMVQQAMMKAIASSNEAPSKNEKGSKKSKAPKGKSAGGRKSTGAAPSRKAGGGKKGAAKKTLTAADKDHIANAINDLEYPHLDRAIEIIKKDTGQNENNDGELELDIDQLSNEALLKLWDLCKKVLPGFAKDSAGPAAAPEPSRAPKSKTTAGKPKKNKPMSAQEQEARIAQLTALRQMYKEGGPESSDPAAAGMAGSAHSPQLADSSDDSDSEEE